MAKKAPMSQNSASASTKAPVGDSIEKMVLRARTKSKREYLRMDSDEEEPISVKKTKAKPKKKMRKIDAKKPKKPPTAFFFFLENFRKEYKEQNPDVKSMRDVGKACGEKWKTMTYEEKVQYYDIATEKRAKFDRAMIDYNKKKGGCEVEEGEEESEFDE